jgi:glutamate dehydrogenase
MAWIKDEYSRVVGRETPAVVTGKAIEDGGSLGRNEATALGGVYALLAFLQARRRQPNGMTVAIQGFGNAGRIAARLLVDAGCRLVAVSDSQGGCYFPIGIADLAVLERIKDETRTVKGAIGTTISSEELLTLPVDILVPAALEDAITAPIAENVKASIILELANGPTTLEADAILRRKGVTVLPDVLANAGGVAVSYFEWHQNMQDERWTKQEVYDRLQAKMEAAVGRVLQTAERHHTGLRQAAYVCALESLQDRWQAQREPAAAANGHREADLAALR